MPVVDASVVVDWVAPGGDAAVASVAARDRLAAQDAQLIAPRLMLQEVSNALLTGVRRGRWSGVDADRAHVLLRELPIRIDDESRDLVRAWDLSRRYDDHPVYDMVYVAVAERRGTQLITADDALRERLAGVDWLVGPEAAAA